LFVAHKTETFITTIITVLFFIFKIIEKLVHKEHCWKLLKWVNGLSEENKKGLRIISTVLDIRGAKRFKDKGSGEPKLESVHSFDVNAPVFDAASA
jgi:hypothetical protein